MVLKIHGFSVSTCTRLVALICKEKEIPYELTDVDIIKGESKSPAFKEYQPFGVVPYIDDDGFTLYESRAICRYLIKKYPNQGTLGLIPTDPQAEALFEQASSIEYTNFATSVGPLMGEKVFKLFHGLQTDEARAAEYLATLNAKMDVYEVILGKQKYLAGETVTLADLQHLPFGTLLCTSGYADVFASRPNVARWWSELSSRPAWIAVKDRA
ncbi:glutathione S-transferase [Melanogaster broomeanus]|nr:glutathione S-transferase [Melanogaster broomeanus]